MLTVAITNHNYARFLKACIESAERFADEILIYDDGSTDESRDILAESIHRVVYNEPASGSPVWGSNLAIEQARGDHLMYLDADNLMLDVPDILTADYTYAPIIHINEAGEQVGGWEYPGWPLTAEDALRRFYATKQIPVPWGGVWDVDFLRRNNLTWSHWPSTQMAADFRTCVEWMKADPTIAYNPYPILAFRFHPGQWSESPERGLMEADASALAEAMA